MHHEILPLVQTGRLRRDRRWHYLAFHAPLTIGVVASNGYCSYPSPLRDLRIGLSSGCCGSRGAGALGELVRQPVGGVVTSLVS